MKTLIALVPFLFHSAVTADQISWLNQEKFQITIEPHPTDYAVLERSRDLENWEPVDIVSASDDNLTLTDSVRRKGTSVYRVNYHPRSAPADQDGDGDDDIVEIEGAFMNAAEPFSELYGDTFLASREIYDQFSNRQNLPGAPNVQEVKFLITEIRNRPKLHFINVNRAPFHRIFAETVLGLTSSQFNSQTYFFSPGNRQNIAGSLLYHENYVAPDGTQGLFTVEFWPTDPVPFHYVELAYKMVANNAPFIRRMAFHAPSETQRQILNENREDFDRSLIHTVDTDELFSNVSYQPMNQEQAFGRLVLSNGSDTLSARDIVIFSQLPNDLTYVSGIITEVPQTPLSHVNLKAQQNNIPNSFIANASTHPDIAHLIGQNVFYRVTPQGFEIRPATQEEVENFFESIRPPRATYPPRDFSETEIKPLSEITFAMSDSFGPKAANLAELQRIIPENTPDGYAIPFYYYDEYMKHNGFYRDLNNMLADAGFQSDAAVREQMLADFREKIREDGEMPQWMYDDFTELRLGFPTYVTPRLRSSANAEDSTSFNGAGLYDSYSHYWREGHMGKSVLQVWASLWNFRAYEEREFYRINHRTSMMGILVHPNQKYEQANGVAVASDPYDTGWDSYYFNVQLGDSLVTNPDVNTVPEQFLALDLPRSDVLEFQYIRFSSLVEDGETILTRPQVLDIISKINRIDNHFRPLYRASNDFAMEIEFKITQYGELSIKQARPYNR